MAALSINDWFLPSRLYRAWHPDCSAELWWKVGQNKLLFVFVFVYIYVFTHCPVAEMPNEGTWVWLKNAVFWSSQSSAVMWPTWNCSKINDFVDNFVWVLHDRIKYEMTPHFWSVDKNLNWKRKWNVKNCDLEVFSISISVLFKMHLCLMKSAWIE